MYQSLNDNRLESDAASGCPVTRPELVIVLALLLLGLALRAWHPARMAVEHFDEGVYASNLYCDALINPEAPYSYPDRFLYAPPLLPAFLEAALLIGGSAASVMWVNVLVGSITVLAVWCVARDWFGPVPAIIACALAATSDYHIAFSRTALTDPLLCLWMLLAVYTGWKAVLTRGLMWIALAGISAGLAWCTKYNGWLALAITGSGTLAWFLVSRRSLKTAILSLAVWSVASLIAGTIFWAVVLRDLAGQGGYSAVAANHAQFFVGPGESWPSFRHQVAAHRRLDGWTTLASGSCVLLLGSLLGLRRFTWNAYWNSPDRPHTPVLVLFPLTVLVAGLAAGSSLLLGAGGLVGILLAICRPLRFRTLSESPPECTSTGSSTPAVGTEAGPGSSAEPIRLAGWMGAAWFIGLLTAVPLYHPYPRLSLPWLIPTWILAAAGISRLLKTATVRRSSESPHTIRPGGLAAIAVLLACVAVALTSTRGAPMSPAQFPAWQDRTELRQISRQILVDTARALAELPPSKNRDFDAVFYVYGEPPIFFHLESLANETTLHYVSQPAGNLDVTRPGATDASVATFLITGMHARSDSEELLAATRDLELIATYDYVPSLLVRLDDTAELDQPAPLEQVQLFLLHPPY